MQLTIFEAKSLEELGLTQEQIFTPEAMEFWKQFSPEDFLLNFFYEAKMPIGLLEGYLQIIAEKVDLESIKLNENLDAKQVNEILLKATYRLKDAFRMMHDYWRHLNEQHKADTDNPV